MLIPIGFFGAGAAAGAYELISTTLVSTAVSSVTLSSIASTYKHLQVRVTGRDTWTSGSTSDLKVTFNSDTGANYTFHRLVGNGSAVSSTSGTSLNSLYMGFMPTSSNTANVFNGAILDILDYASTSKYKTARSLSGFHGSTATTVSLSSGAWMSTAAITSMTLFPAQINFSVGTRISLYGIKG